MTVCVDFDRVLHRYEKSIGQGYDVAIDDPIPGAREMMLMLFAQGYRVVVHTSRALTPAGRQAVKTWLDDWSFPYHTIHAKPLATAYIDDLAISFRARRWGRWRRRWLSKRIRGFSRWK